MHMLKTKNERYRQKQQGELKTLLVEPWKQPSWTDGTLEEAIPNSIDLMHRMCGPATPFERNLRQKYHQQLHQYRNGTQQSSEYSWSELHDHPMHCLYISHAINYQLDNEKQPFQRWSLRSPRTHQSERKVYSVPVHTLTFHDSVSLRCSRVGQNTHMLEPGDQLVEMNAAITTLIDFFELTRSMFVSIENAVFDQRLTQSDELRLIQRSSMRSIVRLKEFCQATDDRHLFIIEHSQMFETRRGFPPIGEFSILYITTPILIDDCPCPGQFIVGEIITHVVAERTKFIPRNRSYVEQSSEPTRELLSVTHHSYPDRIYWMLTRTVASILLRIQNDWVAVLLIASCSKSFRGCHSTEKRNPTSNGFTKSKRNHSDKSELLERLSLLAFSFFQLLLLHVRGAAEKETCDVDNSKQIRSLSQCRTAAYRQTREKRWVNTLESERGSHVVERFDQRRTLQDMSFVSDRLSVCVVEFVWRRSSMIHYWAIGAGRKPDDWT